MRRPGPGAARTPQRVTTAYRNSAEQAKLYAKGRTAPGRIVTNAKPGSSAHRFGHLAKQAGLEWAGAWHEFVELCHVQVPKWKTLKKWKG